VWVRLPLPARWYTRDFRGRATSVPRPRWPVGSLFASLAARRIPDEQDRHHHPDGSVTTIRSSSGCGCGAPFTGLLVLFVLLAPAYYAGRWPLGWTGAVIAYIVLGVVTLGALVAWVKRRKVAGSPYRLPRAGRNGERAVRHLNVGWRLCHFIPIPGALSERVSKLHRKRTARCERIGSDRDRLGIRADLQRIPNLHAMPRRRAHYAPGWIAGSGKLPQIQHVRAGDGHGDTRRRGRRCG
jgi:hypothetical protein